MARLPTLHATMAGCAPPPHKVARQQRFPLMIQHRSMIVLRSLALGCVGPPATGTWPAGTRQPALTRLRLRCAAAPPFDSWTALVGCGTAGMLADRTAVGRVLTGPVSAMLLAAVLANLGLLPDSMATALPGLQGATVKLATPLLLFSADLRKVLRGARALLPAFALGACGTLAGVIVADWLLHPQLVALGAAVGDAAGGLNLAGALAAKNIGGGLNYVAVATSLDVPRVLFTAGIAIDNIAALIYFPLVSFLGSIPRLSGSGDQQSNKHTPGSSRSGSSSEGATGSASRAVSMDGVAEAVMVSLAVALAVVSFSEQFGSRAAMPIATALTVLLATGFPEAMERLSPCAELLGKVLLFVFFASAGASAGSLAAILQYGVLFAFLGVLYFIHLLVVLGIGAGVLGLKGQELLVASNANIGGPATAASLANAKGWDHLLVPGILLGNLGNAVATFIGIAAATWLRGL